MKIRMGFVSNSSSSSFILIFKDFELSKGKIDLKLIQQWLNNNCPETIEYYKQFNIVDTEFLQHACEILQAYIKPLINPNVSKQYMKFSSSSENKEEILEFIGFKTQFHKGNHNRRKEYATIYNRIEKQEKKGFYIVLGQDSYFSTIYGTDYGEFLERCFKELRKKDIDHFISF